MADPKNPKPAAAADTAPAKAPKGDKAKPMAGRVSEAPYSPLYVHEDIRKPSGSDK